MSRNKFYLEGRKELERAITFDEQKKYNIAVTPYIKAIEYHIAGYKRDKNEAHRNQIYIKIQTYLERAETVKVLEMRADEANLKKYVNNDKDNYSIHEGGNKRRRQSSTSDSEDKILFKDIKGLEYSKMALYESVILPQKQPQVFQGARRPFKGILLYGPPGTGKTMLAQALSNEANCHFLNISASDIFSKGMGDSEKNLRSIFKVAREKKPCILFIDEIDSIGRKRQSGCNGDTESNRRVKTELLKQLDGFDSNDGVMILGATNTPWEIDSALRRRFEKRIFTPLPTLKARAEILKSSMGDEKCSLSEKDYVQLAKELNLYSSADCSMVVREALMVPIRKLLRSEYFQKVQNNTKNYGGDSGYIACKAGAPGAIKMNIWAINPDELIIPTVNMADFQEAIKRTKPSINRNDLTQHYEFATKFGGMPDKHLERKIQEKEDLELKRVMEQSRHTGSGLFGNIVRSLGSFFNFNSSSHDNDDKYGHNLSNTTTNRDGAGNNNSNDERNDRRLSGKKKRRVAAPLT
eukprot:g4818.t1